MDNRSNKATKWIYRLSVSVLILFALLPLIVHTLFKIESPSTFWQSTWTSGEILNYAASFCILVVTVLLSYFQISIAEKQYKLEERQLFIEKRKNHKSTYKLTIYMEEDYKNEYVLVVIMSPNRKEMRISNVIINAESNDMEEPVYQSFSSELIRPQSSMFTIPINSEIRKCNYAQIDVYYNYESCYGFYSCLLTIEYDFVENIMLDFEEKVLN